MGVLMLGWKILFGVSPKGDNIRTEAEEQSIAVLSLCWNHGCQATHISISQHICVDV